MALTKLILKRPVSVVIVIIGLAVFGVISILSLPMELSPEISLPMLVVSTVYPNASPEDVEKLISREIESAVSSLSNVKSVTSNSMENFSLVMLTYEYGVNMDIAYSDLKERLDGTANSLPDAAFEPLVVEIDMNALMGAMTLSVTSETQDNLRYFVEDKIEPEFLRLSSVADVSLSGGRADYIRVELNEARMQQYGISMDNIVAGLNGSDFSLPVGESDFGGLSLPVRGGVEATGIDSLKKMPLTTPSGAVIRLADVADVHEALREADSVSRFNERENISLDIQKRQSVSVVDTSREVRETMDELARKYPDVSIAVVQDSSEMVSSSIRSVATALVLGIVIAMLILFCFFGDLRASLIVGSSMPVSLLLTFIMMNLAGFNLNVVTLGALVMGVGMIVDNSIVVIDSCFESHSQERTIRESVLQGVKFVLTSVIGATLTTVVVFFPLATIQGMVGQMFTPLGFTIIFALSASLISAVTLVPLFFVTFKPIENDNAPLGKFLKILENGYVRLLGTLLNRRKTVALFFVGFIALSLFLASQLDVELSPATDEGIILIEADMRPGLNLQEATAKMALLEELAQENPEVDAYSLTVGASSSIMNLAGGGSAAAMYLYLKDSRTKSTGEIIEQLREDTKVVTESDIRISSSGSADAGMSTGAEINLKGNDFDVLRSVAVDVQALMENHPGIIRAASDVQGGNPQVEIIVDPMLSMAHGLTPSRILAGAYTALNGAETITLRQGEQAYEVWVEYPPGKYDSLSDLSGMILTAPNGKSVPLADLAEFKFTDSPGSITREDNQYIVTVTGAPTLAARYSAPGEIEDMVAAMDLPEGVELAASSMDEMMTEEFSSLAMAIAVAVLLVFMVMAIQFESPRFSLMVMACIPLSMIGSFVFLFVSGATLNIASILGFLILVGSVVNNGILYVNTADIYRRDEGMGIRDALLAAGRTRLRPILMTTLTTVLAMTPMALGLGSGVEMMQSLGLVVIGGLSSSTLLSLFLLPVFYLAINGKRGQSKNDESAKAAPEILGSDQNY
jgi:multidrug efflux pump subunit AcrB